MRDRIVQTLHTAESVNRSASEKRKAVKSNRKMATRGITQLLNLRIVYSDFGGSSRGVRDFIENGQLVAWATAHPETMVHVVKRNARHPIVEGAYLTSGIKHTNSHQVCVKNVEADDVWKVCNMLANRSGRKITKIQAPVLTDTPSIQGIWTPFLTLHLEPPFRVAIVEPPSAADADATSDQSSRSIEGMPSTATTSTATAAQLLAEIDEEVEDETENKPGFQDRMSVSTTTM